MNEQPLTIELDRDVLEPGESLTGRYRLDAEPADEAQSVELVVSWSSEGKGDEDRAIQFQETRIILPGDPSDALNGEFSIVLPTSPLSYDGVLIRIVWSVQARFNPARGKQVETQVPFQLGHVARVTEVET